MKREEAIKTLTSLKEQYEIAVRATEHVGIKAGFKDAYDAINTALAALCGPTREQVEAWRGEWIGSADGYADGELVYDIWECSECGYVIDEEDDPDILPQFCPKCYAAMTDKAVDIVMERLEGLYETE